MPATGVQIRWTTPITSEQVRRLILSEPNTWKALGIFDSATAEYSSGFRHDMSTFSLISSRLAAAGLLRPAALVLSQARSEFPLPLPDALLLPLLRSLARARQPLAALRFLRRAPALLGRNPSNSSYSVVLSSLVASNHLRLARDLYKEMKDLRFPPSVMTLNSLIKALCSSGSLGEATRAFRRMPDTGCNPDHCTYNILIDALCKGGRLDEARKLFDEMCHEKSLSPTVITYTSLIHGLCRSHDLDGALAMFDEMSERGLRPNVVTYSSLVDGLCKGGRAMKAMEVVEQMTRKKCKPNMITFSSLINGLCDERRIGEAMEVLDRMRLQERKPDAGLYGKLVLLLCEMDRHREAANLLDEMGLAGILPNRVTRNLHAKMHNMSITGLCQNREGSRAFQIFRSARARGITVGQGSFSCLVDFFCQKNDLQKAFEIVWEMLLSDGCTPDQGVWRSIMGSFCIQKKVQESAQSLCGALLGECPKS